MLLDIFILVSYWPVRMFWNPGSILSAGDRLSQMKSGILNFTAAAKIAPAEVILLYLVAAADPDDAIARRGEELLKKRCLFVLVLNMMCRLSP